VIFGGGYAVNILERLDWLVTLDLAYWGDLDTHGFAILNRLRRRFPRVRSVLMDRETLLAHQSQWVPEPTPTRAALDLLTPAEQDLYQALVAGAFGPAVRLEQERVNFAWLEQAFQVSELHARDAARGCAAGSVQGNDDRSQDEGRAESFAPGELLAEEHYPG
jgi:hypothetical protein